jgi:hypothetical protein
VQKIHPFGDATSLTAPPIHEMFLFITLGMGNAAMDMTLRDLTADELERVVAVTHTLAREYARRHS